MFSIIITFYTKVILHVILRFYMFAELSLHEEVLKLNSSLAAKNKQYMEPSYRSVHPVLRLQGPATQYSQVTSSLLHLTLFHLQSIY